MSLRLALATLYVPDAIKRRGLQDLVHRTARAFEAVAPPLRGLSLAAVRRRFAAFTREQADWVAASPDDAARAGARLRAEAKEFGQALRERLGVSSRADAMRAARLLYGALGVDLTASLAGSVTVRSCAFSAYYTCATCRIMAAMDEGFFAGLAGEGRLEFTARITDGATRCVALFSFDERRT